MPQDRAYFHKYSISRYKRISRSPLECKKNVEASEKRRQDPSSPLLVRIPIPHPAPFLRKNPSVGNSFFDASSPPPWKNKQTKQTSKQTNKQTNQVANEPTNKSVNTVGVGWFPFAPVARCAVRCSPSAPPPPPLPTSRSSRSSKSGRCCP